MMRKLFAATLCVAFLLPTTAIAQLGRSGVTKYVRLAAGYTSSQLYYEAGALPSEGEGTLLVTSFRVPNDLLVFMKSRDPQPGQEYESSLVVTVEVYRNREKVDEDVWRGEHFSTTYEQTRDRYRDVEGYLTFDLPPGPYLVRLRVADDNSDREAVLPPRRVHLPDFTGLSAGRALMVEEIDEFGNEVRLDLANLSGDAPYGHMAYAVIPFSVPEGTAQADIEVNYSFKRLNEDDLEKEYRNRRRMMERVARDRRRGDADTRLPVELPEFNMEGGEEVSAEVQPEVQLIPIQAATATQVQAGQVSFADGTQDATQYLAVIDLNGRQLDDGTYVLETGIKVGEEEVDSSTRFSTHWRNMPISLNDPEVAIANLIFMTDRSTVRSLRKGNREEKIAKFRAFWEERDPTPETEFNELMAEYYRRIDYAAFEYRTGADPIPDGLMTDRAETYILSGPPVNVQRDFPRAGGVREIWTYEGGKRVIFEASSSVDEFERVDS